MAPSTPPPPSSDVFAALTIASTASVVMSATQMSSRHAPIRALNKGEGSASMPAVLARPLGLRFSPEIDRAAHPEIVEMPGEEILRRAVAAIAQQFEEIVVRIELGAGCELPEGAVERNAMHVDAPIFARPHAARQPAL